MKIFIPNNLIIIPGAGQIFTALIYPYIRHRVFNWYNNIKMSTPLNQEIAKTYGWYIQGLNFSFGLTAILLSEELKEPSPLSVALTGIIAAYWTGKVLTQFAYYPMYQIPQQPIVKMGSFVMNGLFFLFAGVFMALFIRNSLHVYFKI